MAQLLSNNDFSIGPTEPSEIAADWEFDVASPDDVRRVVASSLPIPSPPSGNVYLVEAHQENRDAAAATVRQIGVPYAVGIQYTLTFNLLMTDVFPGVEPDCIVINVGATPAGQPVNIPSVNVWTPFEFQIFGDVTGGGTLRFDMRNVGSSYPNRRIYLDNPSIIPTVICYAGISRVLVQNIDSGLIEEVRAKDVDANKHLVYDTTANVFIPIYANKKTGPTNSYAKIPKDTIAPGQPSEDFYLTRGHYLCIDGKEVKAKDVPGAVMEEANEFVYSILTEPRTVIQINGVGTFTYSPDNWEKRIKQKMIPDITLSIKESNDEDQSHEGELVRAEDSPRE